MQQESLKHAANSISVVFFDMHLWKGVWFELAYLHILT